MRILANIGLLLITVVRRFIRTRISICLSRGLQVSTRIRLHSTGNRRTPTIQNNRKLVFRRLTIIVSSS